MRWAVTLTGRSRGRKWGCCEVKESRLRQGGIDAGLLLMQTEAMPG